MFALPIITLVNLLFIATDGEPASQSASTRTEAYVKYARAHSGDATRGRGLFLDSKGAGCAQCHRAQGQGGEIGPDLSDVGGKYERALLIESVLDPTRQIVEGYRPMIVATAEGRVFTGIVKRESPQALTIIDAEGRRHVIRTADIEQRMSGNTSLMPDGLPAGLSPSDFDDRIGPIHHYPVASIAGGASCPPGTSAGFPPRYRGKYFFMDFVRGWIKVLDPDHPQDVETFVAGLTRPVGLDFGPDGVLYVLLRDAWVIDGNFRPRTGVLLRIRPEPSVLLVGSQLVGAAAVAPAAAKPNIVFILADDLGYGDLGSYGHPRFKTPNLDRMAREGVRMTQLNTPMPFCAPTRAALLTGRYPFRCGLTNNPDPESGPVTDATALPTGEMTLAQVLHAAGYATGMVGKWHLGHNKPEYLPTRRGFDEYLGIPYSNDMRPVRLLDGETEVEYPVVQATLTRRYTERALRFIERSRDRPFFLYFAHAMPHKPLACSESFYKKSGAGLYGDALAELDWSVGRVVARLKDLGLDERTLVVFTSDNGPWYGGSTGGLRGMKGTTWEGGYRVPCIARWPGRLPRGNVCRELAVTMDLFATAVAAAGVAPPRDRVIDGRDLLPVLAGSDHSPHDVIFGHAGPRLATVRDGRWKLHVLPPSDRRDGPPAGRWIDPRAPDGVTILAPFEQCQPAEYPGLRTGDEAKAMSLFDLDNDPGEQHDLAAAHPDVVARLRARYDQMVQEMAGARRQHGNE